MTEITATTEEATPPAKKKRVFMWVFLAFQALFILWLIAGMGGAGNAVNECANEAADMRDLCESATAVGAGIGIAMVLGLWVVVDLILGIGYAVFRLAKRPA
jgi:hypothetical protein